MLRDAMPDSNSFDDLSFIYHPDDLDFVRHLAAQLTERGIRCWLDENEYGDTEAGRQRWMNSILRSYSVAMVLTPSSAQSQLCNALVEFAVINGKRFVSLIVNEDITVDVHPAIAAYPYIFFREGDDVEASFTALCEFLPADQHLRFHTDLLVQAHRWDRQGRAPTLLLAPDRIDQARLWLTEGAQRSPKPSQLQVAFIHASRRQKPTPKRAISRLLIAGIALAAVALALALGLKRFSDNQAIASATAEFMSTSQAHTQIARLAAATETAQRDSSARLLADLAATSGSVARNVRGAAATALLRATSQAEQALTAIAEATQLASEQRATEMARIDRSLAAQSVLESAAAALDAGDIDLALALAWDTASTYDEPYYAYPLLRRIADLAPLMILEAVASTRLQPGGNQIAIIPRSFDRVAIYDLERAALAFESRDHDGKVTALAYSSDGTRLITGTDSGELVIRAADNGDALHRLDAHQGPVTALASSRDGQSVFSAGTEPLLAVWDLASGESVARVDADDAPPPRELVVSADDSRLYGWAILDGQPVMKQWTAESLETVAGDSDGQVYLGFDDDGATAYSGGRGLPAYAGDSNTGDLTLWDLNTGQLRLRLVDGFNWSALDGDGTVEATDALLFIDLSPEAALAGVIDSNGDQRSVLVDLAAPTQYRTFANDLAARLTSARFIDEQNALSVTDDGQLVLWSVIDGSLSRTVGAAPGPLHSITVSDDGDYAVGQAADGSVSIWSIDGVRRPLLGLEDAQAGTALGRAGDRLLVVAEDGSRLLSIESGIDLAIIPESRLTRMNEAATHFAVYHGDGISVYDTRGGQLQSQWQVEFDSIVDLYLSPAGDALAVAEASGDLWLLRADVDEPRRLNAGALAPPFLLRYADDGAFLTVHADRALLWDGRSESPQRAYALGVPADFPLEDRFDAALSPAGDRLLFFVLLENGLAGLTEIALDTDALRRATFVNVEQGVLSRDGESLIMQVADRAVEIVDASSGERIYRLDHDEADLRNPRFVPASNRIFALADNRLQVYDTRAGIIEQEIAHARPLVEFSISAAGDTALTVDIDGVYRVWKIESGGDLLERIESQLRPRALTCAERAQYLTLRLCES